jgi:hypothetical protein
MPFLRSDLGCESRLVHFAGLNGAQIEGMNKASADGLSSMRKTTLFLVLGACFLSSGCLRGGSETTWSAESRSPDGKMVASAFTIEQSGFGTGGGGTDVYLNSTTGAQHKLLILAFSDGSSGPGGMNVGMNWLTPTHLELTYKGQRPFDFQAVKCYGIDISVRDLEGEVPSPSH